MVYVGELACIMEILTKTSHFDKRPTNALIAKAVEICEAKGSSYLTFGRMFYGNKTKSSVVDFKHKNGFEAIYFPKYYIPLSFKGRLALAIKLHRGLLGIVPGFIISPILKVRSFFVKKKSFRRERTVGTNFPSLEDMNK